MAEAKLVVMIPTLRTIEPLTVRALRTTTSCTDGSYCGLDGSWYKRSIAASIAVVAASSSTDVSSFAGDADMACPARLGWLANQAAFMVAADELLMADWARFAAAEP